MHLARSYLYVNPEARVHSNTYQRSFATCFYGAFPVILQTPLGCSGFRSFPHHTAAGQGACLSSASHQKTLLPHQPCDVETGPRSSWRSSPLPFEDPGLQECSRSVAVLEEQTSLGADRTMKLS